MKTFLGIDTSNYTTSVALYRENGVLQKKKLLPVKDGERGIRQSDAVFHHTKAYPDLLKELFEWSTTVFMLSNNNSLGTPLKYLKLSNKPLKTVV